MFKAGLHPCGLVMFLGLKIVFVMTKLCSQERPRGSSLFELHLLTPRGPIKHGHLSTFPTLALKSAAIISLSVQGTLHRTSLGLL